jgi:hypothetical protein
VAAIGCGVQPVPPGFATFFGEFHWTPLQKIKHMFLGYLTMLSQLQQLQAGVGKVQHVVMVLEQFLLSNLQYKVPTCKLWDYEYMYLRGEMGLLQIWFNEYLNTLQTPITAQNITTKLIINNVIFILFGVSINMLS